MGVDYSAVLGYGVELDWMQLPDVVREDPDCECGVSAFWLGKDLDDVSYEDIKDCPVEVVTLNAYSDSPPCVLLVRESMAPGFHPQSKEAEWKDHIAIFLKKAGIAEKEPKWILTTSVW